MKKLDRITPLEKNFSQWYIDVIRSGNLIHYGLVKGTIIFKPLSFGIWSNIQKIMDKKFLSLDVNNVYLPMLIPLEAFNKEKDHIEGFAPELATITRVGQKEIQPLVVRPTSEIPFAHFFKSEIESHRDLPIKFNQWNNIIRWEKTTNPFLRTSEFLWQEGHTCHSTKDEAHDFALKMVNVYEEFVRRDLAIATIVGEKTPKEKFAGAENTYTIEAMTKDKKALQSGTSHYLGQNFSKVFDIIFTDKGNKKNFVHQTSWGISTRLIGAIIMSHGDNNGIVIPPRVAPIQVDIIPVNNGDELFTISKEIEKELKMNGIRCRIISSKKAMGFRIAQSEVEGTPIRIEFGTKDLSQKLLTLGIRFNHKKETIKRDTLVSSIKALLTKIQEQMYINSRTNLESNIKFAETYSDFKKVVQSKFAITFFAGDTQDENKIQEETSATSRCVPFKHKLEGKTGKCFFTGKTTNRVVIFAKAY